jgi:type VI secretion system protein ImpA
VLGIELVHALLDRHWATVHPQLDASDGNDPTMRLNALAPLSASVDLLADLRATALTSTRGGPTVRDVELGLGLAEAANNESVPTESGILEALGQALQREPELAQRLQRGRAAAEGVASVLDMNIGSANAPDLEPLARLFRGLEGACKRLTSTGGTGEPAAGESSESTPSGRASGASVPGSVSTREDVIRTIDKLCDWIERNEPSNPAPLLLRRAQRLMSKSFVDIVRDLVPDGLDQIEKLAGVNLRPD